MPTHPSAEHSPDTPVYRGTAPLAEPATAPAGSVPVHWNAQESLRALVDAGENLAVACRRWEASRTTGHEYDVLDALREYEVSKEKWDHPIKVVHLRPGADGFLQRVDTAKRQPFRVDV